jgi:hypothetical protein
MMIGDYLWLFVLGVVVGFVAAAIVAHSAPRT